MTDTIERTETRIVTPYGLLTEKCNGLITLMAFSGRRYVSYRNGAYKFWYRGSDDAAWSQLKEGSSGWHLSAESRIDKYITTGV